MSPANSSPITVALVDDYDVVLLGVAQMLDQYRDRVLIAEIDTNEPLNDTVDIVLYDSFAQPESDHGEIEVLVKNPVRAPSRGLHLELSPGPDQERQGEGRARVPVQDAARPRPGGGAGGGPCG